MDVISGHPGDFPGILIVIVSSYWLLVLQLAVIFLIVALRPLVLRRFPRMQATYTGFLTGIAAIGVYRGMLNYYNVQAGSYSIQTVDSLAGSVTLLAICVISGFIISFRPLKKMEKLSVRPYQIAILLFIVSILVAIVAGSVTVVMNMQAPGGGSYTNPGGTYPDNIPTATPGAITTPEGNETLAPAGTITHGSDLLIILAMALGSIMPIMLAISGGEVAHDIYWNDCAGVIPGDNKPEVRAI